MCAERGKPKKTRSVWLLEKCLWTMEKLGVILAKSKPALQEKNGINELPDVIRFSDLSWHPSSISAHLRQQDFMRPYKEGILHDMSLCLSSDSLTRENKWAHWKASEVQKGSDLWWKWDRLRVRYLTEPGEVVRDISLHGSAHIIITTQMLPGL